MFRSRVPRGRTSPRAGAPRGAGATRWLCAIVAALGTVVAAGAPAAAQAPAAAEPTGELRPHVIDPHLRAELAGAPAAAPVDYLVAVADRPDLTAIRGDREAVVAALRETAAASQEPVVAHLTAAGAQVRNTFWLSNLVLARSAAGTVPEVTRLPQVSAVLPVAELAVPEPEPAAEVIPETVEDRTWGIDRIGAHRVWEELGLDGTGVRVAVLDTGVAARHPDLAGKLATDDPADPTFPGGWMEWDLAGNPRPGEPRDTDNHGTHVSGTVVGGNASGLHIGVAPGAQLMHGLVLPGGSGTNAQVIAGMQWAIDPYDARGDPAGAPAHVVNMSFVPQLGGINDALVEPVRNLVAAGVVPVAAAGNCGDGCHGSPGNVFEALAAGATDRADDVAGFSSGGTVAVSDWRDPPADWPREWLVPDLSAPGVDVISSVASSLGEPYGVSSGTSMAAPHLAGTAALMLSGNPELTTDDIVARLVATSFFDDRHGGQRPNSRYGHGRIDAFQAVSQVVLDSGVAGTVTDAGTGAPVPDTVVRVVEADVSVRTTADGRYEFRLPPGPYTLEFAWAGRVVTTVGVRVADEVAVVDTALSGVTGVVSDAVTGDPVAGIEVVASGTGVTSVTGADGGYRLYLRPDRYSLDLSGFGYQERTVPDVVVAEAAMTTVDVDLTPLATGTLTGTVRFTDSGLGVPGVTVELVNGPLSAVTDGNGNYTIPEVPIGPHTVAATPARFHQPEPRPILMADGGTVTVDFDLTCGGPCAGRWSAHHSSDLPGSFDSAQDVAVAPDGSLVYVTGGEGPSNPRVYATQAYDPETGEVAWTARYAGPAGTQDSARAVEVSPDGSRVFVTGGSMGRGLSASGLDIATVAYDAATGGELWVARYNGPADDFDASRGMAVSPDGTRVYVTGQSRGGGGTEPHRTDYATVAYDAATGAELWVARYGGPDRAGFDNPGGVAVHPDGSAVYVTGSSFGTGTSRDYATVAYHPETGAELWVARYHGPGGGGDLATAVTASPDGARVVVTGRSTGSGTADDYATIAYHPRTGAEQWIARYNGPAGGLDVANAVTVSPDSGTVHVTGESQGGATLSTLDIATVAYDAATGAEQWAARHDGPAGGTDEGVDLVVTPDGSRLVVTGRTTGEGSGLDYTTLAYHPQTGAEQWAAGFDGAAGLNDTVNAVAVSPDSGSVFVTGRSIVTDVDPLVAPSDYVTIGYGADGDDQSPVFVAHDLRAEPAAVPPGQPVRVRATVTNVGTAAGAYAAVLLVDGEREASTTVRLAPGAAADVEWTVTRDEPGRHQLRVGHAAAEFEVLGVACDRTVTGTQVGPVAVAEGVTCLAGDARVFGGVTVSAGAGLVATGATVTGPLTATGAAVVHLSGSRVTGPVSVTGGTGPVAIVGSALTGPVVVSGNDTGGAPVMVSGNRIRGPLTCSGNVPDPATVTPNAVTGPTTGQCA